MRFPIFFIFNDVLTIENGSTSLCCGNSELIRVSINRKNIMHKYEIFITACLGKPNKLFMHDTKNKIHDQVVDHYFLGFRERPTGSDKIGRSAQIKTAPEEPLFFILVIALIESNARFCTELFENHCSRAKTGK